MGLRVNVTIVLLLAGPAGAGAWLQAERTGFGSLYSTVTNSGNVEGGAYVEYGYRQHLTFGAQFDFEMAQGVASGGFARFFLRKPLGPNEGPSRLAYELSLGVQDGPGTSGEFVSTGLSYGRGITLRDRSGWLALDGRVDWPVDGGDPAIKIDATLGLSLNDRLQAMVQVFFSDDQFGSQTTLAPALLWQRKPDGPTYLIGIEAERGATALKLGLWREF